MFLATAPLAPTISPAPESEANRVARLFTAECDAAALEVFQRHRHVARPPHAAFLATSPGEPRS